MIRVISAFTMATALAITSGAAAARKPPPHYPPPPRSVHKEQAHKQQQAHKRSAQTAHLHRLAARIAALRTSTWDCQDTLHLKRVRASDSIRQLPRSVAYRKWTAKRWYRRSIACKELYAKRVLPATNDWLTAVNIAQRVYPGTKEQALAISRHEGGNGPWVWYAGSCSNPPCLWRGYHVGGDNVTGDDTVGGWCQFRFSTFAPYWRQTQEDLRRRGIIIPELHMPPEGGDPKYVAWLSPLAQALTVGYMHFYGKQGSHWRGVPGE